MTRKATRGTNTGVMSMLTSIKDVVLGQAMKLAGNPAVTKLMGDPRLMNAAMKVMTVGGSVKSGVDKASRVAAGVFGLATQEEMANLRTSIQTLEDTIATMEAKAAAEAAKKSAAAVTKKISS